MILAARWILPITHKPLTDGAVLVEKGKIKKVGKKEEILRSFPRERVLDFGEAVLLPGFVDTHTHLEYAVFRGLCDDLSFVPWKIQVTKKERKLNPEDWEISAKLGVLEAIQSGITCVADTTKSEASLKILTEAGLRGAVFYEIVGMDPAQTDHILAESKAIVSKWQKAADSDLIQVGLSPYSVYTVSPPLFKAVSRWAKKNNLPISLHLAGSKDEYLFVQYGSSELATKFRELMGWGELLWQPLGVSPVKYLEQWEVFKGRAIAVHCVQVDDADLDILEANNVAIAHCPKCSAKLGMGVAPLAKFQERKLKVGLGTDSPASNNTMDILDETRTGLLLQRGVNQSVNNLGAKEFLMMSTLGGAEVLGIENKVGSLEEGKEADIIGVEISHSHQIPVRDPYSTLVYTASQEDIMFTMVKGKILYQKGKASILAQEDIRAQVDKVRSKLY